MWRAYVRPEGVGGRGGTCNAIAERHFGAGGVAEAVASFTNRLRSVCRR